MSKALARRKKKPIARRRPNPGSPGLTYTAAAAIGAIAGGLGSAIRFTDPPPPPTRAKTALRGAVQGAVILTVAALLYREYQIYGV